MNSAFWKNFVVLTVGNVLTPICSVALVLAIGRLNGPEALGQYSLLMAVFVVGQSCASFGFPIVLTREVARAPDLAGRYYGSACSVALIALAPAVLVGLGAVSFVDDPALRDGLRLVLLALFPAVLALLAEAVLLGLEHSEYFVGINLAENIARVGLSTALVLLGYGVVSLAVVILVLRVAASGVFLIVLRRKQVTLRLRPDPALCREFFRHMSVLGAIPIVNAVYTRLDIFLLSGLRGVAEVGVYSAAMRLVDVIRILPMAYTRAIYPLMARLHTGDSADRRRTLRVATAILLVIVL
jgi:O-antigen/teichoic acid export membrane protein